MYGHNLIFCPMSIAWCPVLILRPVKVLRWEHEYESFMGWSDSWIWIYINHLLKTSKTEKEQISTRMYVIAEYDSTIKDVCCKSNKSKTKQLLAVIKDADYNQFTAIYGKPINKQRLKIVENDISVITRDKIISTLPFTNLKRDIYEYDQNIDVDL